MYQYIIQEPLFSFIKARLGQGVQITAQWHEHRSPSSGSAQICLAKANLAPALLSFPKWHIISARLLTFFMAVGSTGDTVKTSPIML